MPRQIFRQTAPRSRFARRNDRSAFAVVNSENLAMRDDRKQNETNFHI
jgi:hypothetical protein